MRLYAGLSTHFIRDTVQNQIAGKLQDAFFRHFRYKPPRSEVNSWRNSLRALCQVFETTSLTDHGVILEFQLPLTSRRLDCLVCGRDDATTDQAVIVELKQWESCSEAFGDDLVTTFLGGGERETLHPAVQVDQYRRYLQDTSTAFHEGDRPVSLSACSYLHNYYPEEGDFLFHSSFSATLERAPAFTADQVGALSGFLADRLAQGQGEQVLRRVEESRYRPSKKLMEHVGRLIKGKPEYVLLDEQLVIYQKVFAWARTGYHDRKKTVVIVQGGPGTGKSVIAMNLVGDLLLQEYNAHYATGSRAFTETLRRIIGTRGSAQFKYFNSYMKAEQDEIDVLVCDEAHRIREVSHNRWTAKAERTDRPQIDELIAASKVSVFFIDDRQLVRPDEVGSSELIREHAERWGCRVLEHELEAQFRCAGSEGFVNWLDNTLGIRRTANVLWDPDEAFDFRIMSSPDEVDAAIRTKAALGHSARMTAGFCWKWSKPKEDGTLVEDVRIGDYRRPWNAKPNAGGLAEGIPKAQLWAHEPAGIDQVGCVYTAQGFEFDYVGVLFGSDLKYDFDAQEWVGDPGASYDTAVKRSKDQFVDLVKNTYRVLLSRGLKGCYVHFMDRDTERFVRSRIDVSYPAAESTHGGELAAEDSDA